MRRLDIKGESRKAASVRQSLQDSVVGQSEAIDAFVDIVERYHANLYDTGKPINSTLLLGPTGVGKTKLVESFCEAVHGDSKHMLKLDCGEYQHSHEIAKLIGSPPGYLGHRETPPLLTQERVNSLHSKDYTFAVILLDEIEKASDAFWHILLGVLDKGRITLGTNGETDLTKTVILMTSNAGSGEMEAALNGGTGFRLEERPINDAEIATIGINAAKRKFTTEFINRLDRITACHALTVEQSKEIVKLELRNLQRRIFMKCSPAIGISVSAAAQQAILDKGYDPKYNARNIKRVIEREIELPLAKIVATKQVKQSDEVFVNYNDGEYTFFTN